MTALVQRQGITPGMSHQYGTRTVESRMAFVLKHLRPGMRVLDVGCGPGSITLGIADAVAPGQVVGIDYDARHVEAAQRLAEEHGVGNVTFQVADVYDLPFEEASFDAAVESSVFIHLQRRVNAAEEVHRVLRPSGFFATSDTCMDGIATGPPFASIREAYRLFQRWHRSRGSDLKIGRRMPGILRRAGFEDVTIGASTTCESGAKATARHAKMLGGLFEPGGGIRETALAKGWADEARLDRIAEGWRVWGAHPDAFVVFVMCEMVARKAG